MQDNLNVTTSDWLNRMVKPIRSCVTFNEAQWFSQSKVVLHSNAAKCRKL